MVKGISRQVIVVNSPDPKLFEQAIFILRDGQPEITDDVLIKEAKRLIGRHPGVKMRKWYAAPPVWTATGALFTGMLWLIFTLL